jgi:phosphodiesterase/alkaline phosphatase D-like protein
MKLGGLDISTVKLGANQVQAVYQGVDLVWQNAPVATAATGVGQTSFTANWNAYTGAVVYLLDVSESSDFSTFVYEDQQVNAPTTSYVVIGLNPNTTYYYRVRANVQDMIRTHKHSLTELQLLEVLFLLPNKMRSIR